MPALRSADQDQLQKLLLGQLPSVEVERLATEYADDSRLAELAESLAGQDDALLHLLRGVFDKKGSIPVPDNTAPTTSIGRQQAIDRP